MELADRLPFCPRCSYPFTGLPEAHQCPECGLAYNLESRMWTSVAGRWGARRTINLFLGLVSLLLGLRLGPVIFFPEWHIGYFVTVVIALFFLRAAYLFLRAWKLDQGPKSRFFAVMPDGI